MKVMDISDWNDRIDWDSVIKTHHVEGVIVKISEGRGPADLYADQIAAAEEHGLPWGVYCYTHATTTDRAKEEAEVVLNAIEELGHGAPKLGIWYDVEDDDVLSLKKDDVTAICSAFITACNHRDYSAGIYASLYTFIDNIDVKALADYVPYWCAQYDRLCDFKEYFPENNLKGWQYTDAYEIDGAFYDMNEWY